MLRIKSTRQHIRFWKTRQIDWNKDYLQTWNHPHRQLIVWALQTIPWVSLWEAGCGPGPNLVRITKSFQGKQLGGSDVNAEAIELARSTFVGGKFHVESVENMLLSDGAVDVMLSDAALIYIGPTRIKKALHEMVRIARNNIVLCEFHGTSWWQRFLFRLQTGYNAYDYVQLLEAEGCYDIQIVKITKEFWDGTPWTKWGHIIMAKIPKK